LSKLKIPIIIIFVTVLIYFLSLVFSGRLILPQTFSFGFVTIHYYGIILAIAVFCSYYLAIKSTSKYDISVKQGGDIIFWIIIGGLVGARIYHVFSSVSYYSLHSVEILKVWHGGLSIYGALIGGFLALLLWKKLTTYNLPALSADRQLTTLLNWLTPSLVLGQIIGRLGNLFNYEVYGYPTNLPWKMLVPREFRLSTYWDTSFYHPWFLYEQLGLILIWCVLKFGLKGQKSNLFISYVLLYNLMRFGLEFLRIDSNFIGQFRQNAVVSLCLAVGALGLIIYGRVFKSSKNAS
jgi:phosphatidylglycerol:prolipoprotein diacylglycerol transferase